MYRYHIIAVNGSDETDLVRAREQRIALIRALARGPIVSGQSTVNGQNHGSHVQQLDLLYVESLLLLTRLRGQILIEHLLA